MRRIPFEVLAAIVLVLLISRASVSTQDQADTYAEECVHEGCSTGELRELYDSYWEECIHEGCSAGEIEEISGDPTETQSMLSAFLQNQWYIRSQDISQSRMPSNSAWLYSNSDYSGLLFQVWQPVNPSVDNLSDVGFNDATTSVKVGTSIYADLYTGTGFSGSEVEVFQNDPDINSAGESLSANDATTFGVSSASVASRAPITFSALPSTIYIGSLDVTLTNVHGFQAQVPLAQAEIVVPDLHGQAPCSNHSIEGTRVYDPVYDILGWQEIEATQLKINGNFFQVFDSVTPHNMTCTNLHGLSVSNGTTVSQANVEDFGNLLDAILFLSPEYTSQTGHNAVIVTNASISTYTSYIQNAVSGVIIVQNGRNLSTSSILSSAKPSASGARTGVGLDRNGNTLSIVVIQNGSREAGMTAKQLGAYMIQEFQVDTVLNLDNSGSSQLLYVSPTQSFITMAGDSQGYRPVPNFLGIK